MPTASAIRIRAIRMTPIIGTITEATNEHRARAAVGSAMSAVGILTRPCSIIGCRYVAAAMRAEVGHVLSTQPIGTAVWLARTTAERLGHFVNIAQSRALIGFDGWIV
jgi:hypothetical protein